MKPLVIYHDKCTDGFGAAFAAWLKLGDEAEYVPQNYGQASQYEQLPAVDGREVYILDFSYPREWMEIIFARAKRVAWLDHHKTAFEMWCEHYTKGFRFTSGFGRADVGKPQILLDDNKSGAMLAWEYFYPDRDVPLLIRHIDDRDRWQWKMDGSAEVHAALQSLQPWTFEQWKFLLSLSKGEEAQYGHAFLCNAISWPMFRAQGEAILRAQKQHVERIAKGAVKCVVPYHGPNVFYPDHGTNYKAAGLAVNTPIFQSEVGHELANTSGSFGLSWYMADVGRARCSFRSNGDYDVSAIARAFGGGGHRNAAGCEVELATLVGWLK